MKVLHVVPSYHPARIYGGPIVSVHRLCAEVARAGHPVRVLTTNAHGRGAVLDVPAGREVALEPGLEVRYCRRVIPEAVSLELLGLLPAWLRWADVVHLTAVYSFPVIPTLLACRALDRPMVWSPRGGLQRWHASRRRSPKAVWDAACRAVRPRRIVLHATSEEEARESSARTGLATAVVPNGVDVPERPRPPRSPGPLRVLFLGRVDPKKGVENLLSACALVAERRAVAFALTVAGAGEPRYVQSLRALAARLGIGAEVIWPGHVEAEAKARVLDEADLLVCPSHTESFAMVVAEALAHGVAVIASRGTPWARLVEVGAGLWVDNDPGSLAQAIEAMAGMPLDEMGQRGRLWVRDELSWPRSAQRMIEVYRDVLGVTGAAAPFRGSTGRAG